LNTKGTTYAAVILLTAMLLTAFFSTIIPTQLVFASPYDDGYNKGLSDSNRDARGANGHGCDSSLSSPHSAAYRNGYSAGYAAGSCGSGSGGGAPPSGQSQSSLVNKVCNFAQTNPTLAAGAAALLGYPGLDVAVRTLCAVR
jgi:hypothetical protein